MHQAHAPRPGCARRAQSGPSTIGMPGQRERDCRTFWQQHAHPRRPQDGGLLLSGAVAQLTAPRPALSQNARCWIITRHLGTWRGTWGLCSAHGAALARGLSRHMCHTPLRHLARHLARHLGSQPNLPPDLADAAGGMGCPAGRGIRAASARGGPTGYLDAGVSNAAQGVRAFAAAGSFCGHSARRRHRMTAWIPDAARRTPPSPSVHLPDPCPWDVARATVTFAARGPDGHEPSLAQVPSGV